MKIYVYIAKSSERIDNEILKFPYIIFRLKKRHHCDFIPMRTRTVLFSQLMSTFKRIEKHVPKRLVGVNRIYDAYEKIV